MADGHLGCGLLSEGETERVPPAEGLKDRVLLERFVRRQDETAFDALVERHGPMVLGVCQRVLHHAQDAEDAFQATFLVLVRKAGSLTQPELLANWLYGVAYRTALKARAASARRGEGERQAGKMSTHDPLAEVVWREMRSVIDEELCHLPEKYRAPLVLCYLQGKTNAEAARQLGWPAGSMSARLARGRDLLRERLARRQRALPAGVFTAVLAQKAGAGAIPTGLAQATVQAAAGLASGQTLGLGLISPKVLALMEATLESLGTFPKSLGALILKIALVIGLLLAISAGVGAAVYALLPPGPTCAR
jgi:RNA polymerase sigma factor (sigma-70 family)